MHSNERRRLENGSLENFAASLSLSNFSARTAQTFLFEAIEVFANELWLLLELTDWLNYEELFGTSWQVRRMSYSWAIEGWNAHASELSSNGRIGQTIERLVGWLAHKFIQLSHTAKT